MRARIGLCLGLLACGTEVDVPDGALDDDAVGTTCAAADCLRAGEHTFQYAGGERTVQVWLPEEPAGAPVLFVWHHLGGSPDELLGWMPLDGAVDDGFVVVAAESRGLFGTEWDFVDASPANEDLALFDAMLDSLIAVQAVDETRVYATGFSAGGLFTTFLTMHRADALAATAPFSGGAPASAYHTPARAIPVMLSWGGPLDNVYGFDFDGATRHAAGALAADGHVVLRCDHGLGHWLPDDATTRTLDFFGAHAAGESVPDYAACSRVP